MPVGANTLNHELANLRAVFNELERLGEWGAENPFGKVRSLKCDETEMAYLDSKQIPPLLAELVNDRRRQAWLPGYVWRLGHGGRRLRDWRAAKFVTDVFITLARIHQRTGRFRSARSCRRRSERRFLSVLLREVRRGGGGYWVGAAGRADDACVAAYFCQPLHDEWRGYSDVTAGAGACFVGYDDAVCAF